MYFLKSYSLWRFPGKTLGDISLVLPPQLRVLAVSPNTVQGGAEVFKRKGVAPRQDHHLLQSARQAGSKYSRVTDVDLHGSHPPTQFRSQRDETHARSCGLLYRILQLQE